MLAWEVYNGPKNNVEAGMSLPEALAAMGNIKKSSLVVSEVPNIDPKAFAKDINSADGRRYLITYRGEKFLLTEMHKEGDVPLGSFDNLDGLAAELQKHFGERKNSAWHVTLLCVTSPITRTTFGYMMGPDIKVYNVSPISYSGN